MACGDNFDSKQEVTECTTCESPRVREIKTEE